ncbi:MAG: bifunctional 4-hydroxy-2-oxoglutarate aldolase/2-dehydro-3-deoxy-phosphogluconate aldolase [Pseudomonadota bacterium]
MSVFEQLGQCPIIPVIVIETRTQAVPMAEALIAGGLEALEVTLRTPDALGAIEDIAKALPEAMVGAGTVSTAAQFDDVKNAGGRFAVSPCLTATLAAASQRTALPWLPGAVTATEVQLAREAGFVDLKFFPAGTSGGPGHLKSLSAVYPDVRFCPTGGVNLDNLAEYLGLPAVRAVGGSWLTPAKAVAAGDWASVTETARAACSAAAAVASS